MFPCVSDLQPIHLYLPHGDINGLATASTGDGSVKVYRVPRSKLHDYELGVGPKDNGVFFLVGGDTDGSSHCYMASGHDLPARIAARDVETSRWQTAYYAVSGGAPWSQTEAGYIGSDCAAKAADGGRYALYGPATGVQSTPSPELAARSTELAEVIALLMKTLGCGVLGEVSGADPEEGIFHLRDRGSDARMKMVGGGYVVLAGSYGRESVRPSCELALVKKRQHLNDLGAAEVRGNNYVFLEDYAFGSPSTAAGVVIGGNTNGRDAWKNKQGSTLKQVQERSAGQAAA